MQVSKPAICLALIVLINSCATRHRRASADKLLHERAAVNALQSHSAEEIELERVCEETWGSADSPRVLHRVRTHRKSLRQTSDQHRDSLSERRAITMKHNEVEHTRASHRPMLWLLLGTGVGVILTLQIVKRKN